MFGRKKICKFLVVVLALVFSFSITKANAIEDGKVVFETIVDGNIEGEHTMIVSKPSIGVMASTKQISHGFKITIDNVYCYTLRHDINFTYGINTGNGDKAQITTYKSYVSNTNSSSAYYPDTANMTNTLVKLGNPASLKTVISAYSKSTNKKQGTLTAISKCYGTGAYTY